jgi:hypothetical protein
MNKDVYAYNAKMRECQAAFKKKENTTEAKRPSSSPQQGSASPKPSTEKPSEPSSPGLSKLLQETREKTQGADAVRQRQRDEIKTEERTYQQRQEADRAAEEAAKAARERQKQLDAERTQRDLENAKAWVCSDGSSTCFILCTKTLSHSGDDRTLQYRAMREAKNLPRWTYLDAQRPCHNMCEGGESTNRRCFNSLFDPGR